MSQGVREMLANRKFAIPLIILLAFCLVGLILVGIVILLRPGADEGGEPVAGVTLTVPPQLTTQPTATTRPTQSPTPRPSPTMVSLGTPVSSTTGTAAAGTPVVSATGTQAATAAASPTVQATATPSADEELADTGVGWGLILFSGIGLAMLAIVARRLRMAH